jgi:hypothetical protein
LIVKIFSGAELEGLALHYSTQNYPALTENLLLLASRFALCNG